MLSPVMTELRASINDFRAKMGEARAEVAKLETESRGHMAKFQAFGRAAALGVGAAVAAIGIESIKMAGDFQTQTSVLQTAAGETTAGLKVVRAGILDIAKSTGTTWQNLTEGMYQVEKAGYRGADGLQVLRAAAQGAKEEGAQLSVVTNAMTSIMASYNIPTSKSVQVMNALKTAAAGSKDTMQNFASSISTVMPIASAAHLSFAEVGGALAAITRHGTSAQQATQEMANAIRNLIAPNNLAQNTMAQFGISAVDVTKKLGERGLTGTMQYLTDVVAQHVKGGLVQVDVMKKSAAATDDLKRMMESMSPAARTLATDMMNNTISVLEFRKGIKHLDPHQTAMARQFATLALKAKGFSDQVRAGQPVQTTMESILKKITGGAVGLNTALMLTGSSGAYANEMTKRIGESMSNASKDVEGWKQTQDLFNTRLDRFKQTLEVLAIQIGTRIIPVLTSMMDWVSRNRTTVEVLAAVVGGALLASMIAAAAAFVAANAAAILIGAALAALAVGFTYLWQHSERFRDVTRVVFDEVKLVVLAFAEIAVKSFTLLLRVWMETAGGILHGAAVAFSWIPGLGGKLKAADDAFRGMKDAVLGTMDKFGNGIHDQLVKTQRDALIQADITSINIKTPLADRLPEYQALARKYGETLPQVLDQAHIPTADKARMLAETLAVQMVGQQGYTSAVARQVADLPRGAWAAAVGRAYAAAGMVARAPHAALMAQEADIRAAAFQVGAGMSDAMALGIQLHAAGAIASAQALARAVTIASRATGVPIGGHRAKGGPVRAGVPYIVGEKGPELITPTADGYVHTADVTKAMGGGTSINVTLNGASMDPTDVARELAWLMKTAAA